MSSLPGQWPEGTGKVKVSSLEDVGDLFWNSVVSQNSAEGLPVNAFERLFSQ
ncbi:hypothetical protein DPMN_092007 [Dreissena polymorpha]|uniref:Uncharacterized protein n=1 Tax=Dreissena polymorpha TaxID=45954 RepID=A0A9D4L1J7_DREPO|nr:hypothetical protein DPMN_092007 [Dreissena polymorpha]